MNLPRRQFLGCVTAAAVAARGSSSRAAEDRRDLSQELDLAAAAPVLQTNSLRSPVIIESMELLRNGETFLVHVRSREGAEGISAPIHNGVFRKPVNDFFKISVISH